MNIGKTCVVTGGAGFIGCAISHALNERYDRVIAMDILHPQIHGQMKRPLALDSRVELYVADVCDPKAWDQLLDNLDTIDTVVHLAAETGTAQSLEESTRHGMTNVVGTTTMLDAFQKQQKLPRQILLASSRAVYGEGAWETEDGVIFYPGQRSDHQLSMGQWGFPGAHALPSKANTTVPHPSSVYGATKLAQEHILSAWAQSFGVISKVLRFQNVYGPGQSLINTYTGMVLLFVRLARKGQSIPLYEDGLIMRDFVYIDDVADAIILALEQTLPMFPILDVGTGIPTSIQEAAGLVSQRYGALAPQVCGRYRNGDVRNASCSIEQTRKALGYAPKWGIEAGIQHLCTWVDAILE